MNTNIKRSEISFCKLGVSMIIDFISFLGGGGVL